MPTPTSASELAPVPRMYDVRPSGVSHDWKKLRVRSIVSCLTGSSASLADFKASIAHPETDVSLGSSLRVEYRQPPSSCCCSSMNEIAARVAVRSRRSSGLPCAFRTAQASARANAAIACSYMN